MILTVSGTHTVACHVRTVNMWQVLNRYPLSDPAFHHIISLALLLYRFHGTTQANLLKDVFRSVRPQTSFHWFNECHHSQSWPVSALIDLTGILSLTLLDNAALSCQWTARGMPFVEVWRPLNDWSLQQCYSAVVHEKQSHTDPHTTMRRTTQTSQHFIKPHNTTQHSTAPPAPPHCTVPPSDRPNSPVRPVCSYVWPSVCLTGWWQADDLRRPPHKCPAQAELISPYRQVVMWKLSPDNPLPLLITASTPDSFQPVTSCPSCYQYLLSIPDLSTINKINIK